MDVPGEGALVYARHRRGATAPLHLVCHGSTPIEPQALPQPVLRSIPRDLSGKLEPAEAVHEILEHRWYMSEKENRHIPLAEAVQSYIDSELRHRRDEAAIMLNPDTGLLKILEVETEESRYGADESIEEYPDSDD